MECSTNPLRDGRHAASITLARSLDFMSAAMKPVDGVDPASDLQVLKQAIASAPSGIVVCSKFGRVLLANQSITALFGYTPGELSDRDFRTIVPDLTTAAGGTAQDVTGICKDGSIVPVRISVSNVPAHDSLYVASVVDLSQQRNLEERLSAAVSHSRFQTMVAELATRCAATKFDQIDAALGSALAALGEAFAVDRCVAYLPTAHDTSSFRGVWRWCRPGCELPSDDFD